MHFNDILTLKFIIQIGIILTYHFNNKYFYYITNLKLIVIAFLLFIKRDDYSSQNTYAATIFKRIKKIIYALGLNSSL